MPQFNEVISRKPIVSNLSFSFGGMIDAPQSINFAIQYNVGGDIARRGFFYNPTGAGSADPQVWLCRAAGRFFLRTNPNQFNSFNGNTETQLGPLIGAQELKTVTTAQNVDGKIWVMGNDFTGSQFVWVFNGASGLNNFPTGWTNRSADLTSTSIPGFLRKATTTSFYYYIAQTSLGGNPVVVMRAPIATAISGGFTNITTVGAGTGTTSTPKAYDISPDGAKQMLGLADGTTWRSLNGGVNWTQTTSSLGGSAVDIVYSSHFKRWCMAPKQGQLRYSDDDGTSWANVFQTGAGGTPAVLVPIFPNHLSHLEKLDPEGRYILMVTGYAPITCRLSVDGGRSFGIIATLTPPHYDANEMPNNLTASDVVPAVALVNTGSQILLYQGVTVGTDMNPNPVSVNWNFDNSMWSSSSFNIPV